MGKEFTKDDKDLLDKLGVQPETEVQRDTRQLKSESLPDLKI